MNAARVTNRGYGPNGDATTGDSNHGVRYIPSVRLMRRRLGVMMPVGGAMSQADLQRVQMLVERDVQRERSISDVETDGVLAVIHRVTNPTYSTVDILLLSFLFSALFSVSVALVLSSMHRDRLEKI